MNEKITIAACRNLYARNLAKIARDCYNSNQFRMPLFHGACAVNPEFVYKRVALYKEVRTIHGADAANAVYDDLMTHEMDILKLANKLLDNDDLYIFTMGGAYYVNKYGTC